MRAIFLNRDGVINYARADYVKSWDEFRFLPGVFAALRWVRLSGMSVFVITNQAADGHGAVPGQTLQKIHSRMVAQVALHGGVIHDLRHCPHDTYDRCACYTPQPMLLLELAAKWQIDLSRSYLVGNVRADIAAARAAGCRYTLVRGEHAGPADVLDDLSLAADHVAADLPAAVEWILHQESVMSHDHQLSARPQPLIANVLGGLPVSG